MEPSPIQPEDLENAEDVTEDEVQRALEFIRKATWLDGYLEGHRQAHVRPISDDDLLKGERLVEMIRSADVEKLDKCQAQHIKYKNQLYEYLKRHFSDLG